MTDWNDRTCWPRCTKLVQPLAQAGRRNNPTTTTEYQAERKKQRGLTESTVRPDCSLGLLFVQRITSLHRIETMKLLFGTRAATSTGSSRVLLLLLLDLLLVAQHNVSSKIQKDGACPIISLLPFTSRYVTRKRKEGKESRVCLCSSAADGSKCGECTTYA